MREPAMLSGDAPGTPSNAMAGSAIRRNMVLLALLPAGLVAIIAAATAGVGYAAGPTRDEGASWALLTGAALLVCAVLTAAAWFASAQARTVAGRYAELTGLAARGRAELAELLQRIRDGRRLEPRPQQPWSEPAGDGLDRLGHEIASAQRAAEAALVEVAARARGGEQFEVFTNLALRLESLVHREIGLLDDLENEVEDPELLKGLFQVDHLATRIRRYAENLAVLGGAFSHRQWTRPVGVSDVLRSAVAEIDQYSRVKLVPPVEGTVSGHAVVDVVHLLAELVENATVFSPPQSGVLLRVQRVTAGLAIEVEDRGLGMTAAERDELNALLASPERFALGDLLRDGRIGLYVVSTLAQRHGIAVQLQGNVYGGTQAVVVVPRELVDRQPEAEEPGRQPAGAPVPAPEEAVGDPATSAAEPAPSDAGVASDASDAAAMSGSVGVPGAEKEAAPVAEPPLLPTAVPPSPGVRPELPQRRRQEHLSPELRESSRGPGPGTGTGTGAPEEAEHDPGLMAAFQSGVRLAEVSEETDTSH